MAQYPIKTLLDVERNPFFPFIIMEAVRVNGTTKNLNDFLNENYYTKTNVYNKTETYTKQEVDALVLGGHPENYYTKNEVYNKTETYTKEEVNNLIPAPVDLSNYYTKSETYNQTEINTALGNKANASDLDNYLAKNNAVSYTPSGDYNPATKKYVDDSILSAITDALTASY